jgi:shikimate kinase
MLSDAVKPATRIYLVGMPGVGKSTTAKKLAKYLKYTYIDLDECINRFTGKTVEHLFAEEGEEKFRLIETEQLYETARFEKTIIATGGGTAAWHGNMRWMNEHGYTIYIYGTENFIADRLLQSNKDSRPLLKNRTEPDLRRWIHETLEKRKPFYEQAKIRIHAPLKTVKTLVNNELSAILPLSTTDKIG